MKRIYVSGEQMAILSELRLHDSAYLFWRRATSGPDMPGRRWLLTHNGKHLVASCPDVIHLIKTGLIDFEDPTTRNRCYLTPTGHSVATIWLKGLYEATPSNATYRFEVKQ